jgi:hypothetical protein
MSVPAADNLRRIWRKHNDERCIDAEPCRTAADLLEAIDALHQRSRNHVRDIYADWWCSECRTSWPCKTARLLHPPVPAEETLPNTEVRP